MKCAYPVKIDPEITKYLPMVKYTGKVVLVDNAELLDSALSEIEKETILGFDTETRPSFKKGLHYKTSLLQLCGSNCAWLFRLNLLKDSLEKIFKVLANPSIIKTGVAVNGDINGLNELFAFKAKSFIEISEYTQKMGILNTGLKNLSCVFFGERISKSVQMSNWAADELNERQLAYAATDAWISRRLYLEVKGRFDEKNYELELEYPEVNLSFISKVRRLVRDIKRKAISTIKGISTKKPKKSMEKTRLNPKRIKVQSLKKSNKSAGTLKNPPSKKLSNKATKAKKA